MALTSQEKKAARSLEKAGVTEPTDQQRLATALRMARERLATFKGNIRRVVALVDEFDGHRVPVVVEADVEDGEPYCQLQEELAEGVFGPIFGATKVIMSIDIQDDLAKSVTPASLMTLLA